VNRNLIWIDASDPLPPTRQALTLAEGANGLLAAGADLSAERLTEAYSKGIFPWFSRGEPVLWWSPSPRMVLRLDEFKVSKSFRKSIQAALDDPHLQITADQDFQAVMQACAAPRESQSGTWISPPMISAYTDLHQQGLAHSIEVRSQGQLVGGLYCVAIGKMVFGESMFSRQPNASKLALATLVSWLKQQGARMIDCQQHTAHLASLGGREIDRQEFEDDVSTLTVCAPLPWKTSPPSKQNLCAF
jgi:leucyl/phenylalanyl-tRNA---protein transferase